MTTTTAQHNNTSNNKHNEPTDNNEQTTVTTDKTATHSQTRPPYHHARVQQNLAILREFKQGKLDNLTNYSGFGGLRNAFNDNNVIAELLTSLSAHDIERLRKSTYTSYFTPPFLVDAIYQIVQKLGFTNGKILEPACGHGVFFERMPAAMRDNSEITGLEFNPINARIAKALYPHLRIHQQGLQYFHEHEFDLIIGNPPYASFSVFDRQHPDLNHAMIHHYFVAKCVRLLKVGGLMAMVLPNYILDNTKNHLRNEIAAVADLITAYRLPKNLFADAKVTVDIVILQRTEHPHNTWHNTRLVTFADQQQAYLAEYFIEHPSHVLGELATYTVQSAFSPRPRRGIDCLGDVVEVKQRLSACIEKLRPILPSSTT